MGLDDAYKRRQEEDSNVANRNAEEAWENLNNINRKQTELVSAYALIAIAAELRAARKAVS